MEKKVLVEMKGDLLDLFDKGMFDAIGHGANCFCRMRSGIAGQIAQKFPGAVEADNKTVPGALNKLGNFTKWTHPDGQVLYNLYTQYNYGRDENIVYVSYIGLRQAMEGMKAELLDQRRDGHFISVGFPIIGCGLANGDWEIVKGIIEDVWNEPFILPHIIHYSPTEESQPEKLI